MSSAVPSNTMAFQIPRAMLRADVALRSIGEPPGQHFHLAVIGGRKCYVKPLGPHEDT